MKFNLTVYTTGTDAEATEIQNGFINKLQEFHNAQGCDYVESRLDALALDYSNAHGLLCQWIKPSELVFYSPDLQIAKAA